MKIVDIYQNRLHLQVEESNNGPIALLIVTAVTALTDKSSHVTHAKNDLMLDKYMEGERKSERH